MTAGGVKLERSIFITYNLRINTSRFDKTSVVFTDDCFHEKSIRSTWKESSKNRFSQLYKVEVSVHIHLSEHATEPDELPAMSMFKV